MNAGTLYFWLAAGLVPYRIERKHLGRRGRIVKIRSLFWSLEARFVGKRCTGWTLRVPLIERVRGCGLGRGDATTRQRAARKLSFGPRASGARALDALNQTVQPPTFSQSRPKGECTARKAN